MALATEFQNYHLESKRKSAVLSESIPFILSQVIPIYYNIVSKHYVVIMKKKTVIRQRS